MQARALAARTHSPRRAKTLMVVLLAALLFIVAESSRSANGQTVGTPGAPVGAVMPYAGVTTPVGWLVADGQAVSRLQYPELFAAIGTTYGVGDGVTTFNLPDLRGRVPVGVDGVAGRLSSNDLIGQSSGEERHTLTVGEVPSHSHSDGSLATTTVADHVHGDGSLTTSTSGSHTHTDNGHSHGPASGWYTMWQNFVTGWGFGDGPHNIQMHTGTATGYANLAAAGSHSHDVAGSTAGAGSHLHDVVGTTGTSGGGQSHNVMQPYQILNYIIRAQAA